MPVKRSICPFGFGKCQITQNKSTSEPFNGVHIIGIVPQFGLLRLPVLRQREGVRVVPLYSEQLLLAVPPNHALARCQAPVELAQLKDEAFISVPHPQRGGLSYLSAELCMRAGFFPKAARVMSRKTTQLQLIQAGFGIALLPKSMQDIAPANVHFLPLADPDCLSTVALACPHTPSALVEQFCQTLRECL